MRLALELTRDVRLLVLIAAAALLLLLAVPAAFALRAARRPGALAAAALLATAALDGVLLAADPFTLLVAWEAFLPVLFLALVAEGGGRAAGRALAGLGAADLGLVAAAGLLEGTAPAELTHLPATGLTGLAFGLALVPVLGRLGAFPFHGWVADAAEDAASPASALIVALASRLAGVALAIQLVTWFSVEGWAAIALLALGALSAAGGVLRAAVEEDARRAAAHAGTALAGAVLLAAGGNAPLGALVAGLLAAGVGGALALLAGSAPVASPHAGIAAWVRRTPVVRWLARAADADPAAVGAGAVAAAATVLFALERLVDLAVDRLLAGAARGAAALVVKGDGGGHARYVIWSLAGLVLVILVFVGGF